MADLKVQMTIMTRCKQKTSENHVVFLRQNVYWYSLIGSHGCKSPIIGCIPRCISGYIRLYLRLSPIPIHSWLLFAPSVPGWFRDGFPRSIFWPRDFSRLPAAASAAGSCRTRYGHGCPSGSQIHQFILGGYQFKPIFGGELPPSQDFF